MFPDMDQIRTRNQVLPKERFQKKTLVTKIYPGFPVEYWVYVSPKYDAARGVALMVWQDGKNLARGDLFAFRLFTVTENLVQRKLIPPMIHVMIAPGDRTRMRSVQYETVSDRYRRFLLEEVLPEVEKSYKLRGDAYSRAIGGVSSGGTCALNAALYFPGSFSRGPLRHRKLCRAAVASGRAPGWR
jgi:enterochelin esterase-like enzyme